MFGTGRESSLNYVYCWQCASTHEGANSQQEWKAYPKAYWACDVNDQLSKTAEVEPESEFMITIDKQEGSLLKHCDITPNTYDTTKLTKLREPTHDIDLVADAFIEERREDAAEFTAMGEDEDDYVNRRIGEQEEEDSRSATSSR